VGGEAQAVECLPSKHEALSSKPNTVKGRERGKRKENRREKRRKSLVGSLVECRICTLRYYFHLEDLYAQIALYSSMFSGILRTLRVSSTKTLSIINVKIKTFSCSIGD
jgi:hypothetical protein